MSQANLTLASAARPVSITETSARKRPTSRWQALVVAAACMAVWSSFAIRLAPQARSGDFLNLYTGASFALDWNWDAIYSRSGQFARERTLAPGRDDFTPFVRPPVYALVMAPLALIPFHAAFWVWIAGQTAVLLGCWAWAWRRFGPEAVVWGAMLILGPLGIAHGQDCAVFLAVIIGAFVLGERDKSFLSGLVLGLGMVKFHLFLLWPFVLLFQRRWRMLLGLVLSIAGQGALSLFLVGWQGLHRYAEFILHLDRYYSPERYININAILLNFGVVNGPLLAGLTALVIGSVLWCSRRPAPLWMTFALAIAGSLSVGSHVYGYDGTMLLLPAWCVIFISPFRLTKLAAATVCTPVTALTAAIGPPFACLTASVLLLLVLSLCVESEVNYRKIRGEVSPA